MDSLINFGWLNFSVVTSEMSPVLLLAGLLNFILSKSTIKVKVKVKVMLFLQHLIGIDVTNIVDIIASQDITSIILE